MYDLTNWFTNVRRIAIGIEMVMMVVIVTINDDQVKGFLHVYELTNWFINIRLIVIKVMK